MSFLCRLLSMLCWMALAVWSILNHRSGASIAVFSFAAGILFTTLLVDIVEKYSEAKP